MNKISVIGAGSWGTALAMVLADNNFNVVLHSHREAVANEINQYKTNSKYLPGITLPANISSTTSYEEALQSSKIVLIAIPSHVMRNTAKDISSILEKDTIIIHATKGIENDTLSTMSQILREELPLDFENQICVLSGPSHAEEVARKIPTTIVAASENINLAKTVQQIFNNNYFRVYTNSDVIGVELGGALKNIIALGAGISDGLGYGDNGKAALLTRGLSEIIRLGVSLGARESTFSGLTGMGDLIVTGTSKHSRNWKTGNLLAQGYPLEEALTQIGMVAEGVKTTKSAYQLSKTTGIETPITNELFKILFENKCPKQATHDLMNRVHKEEI
ncbi:NAD(P)H-dependent glycerol-3-phosphate dehydrogenase [Bacillus cereus]|uniref:Glycerol-3-phosphate dehydrogenase [NAD(P)+] n=1 Tax=Bacillus cereus TaxID=1396 RepID=A0A9X6XV65_BACCE|nr:NAD(P)H-dependent glycerol-3-phosphate dehydrogenase [Bacillus cereus]PDZ94324.1 NAD(P)H-dependent glycerol-3-phosphate dehydrogenase [Bacillus cereus]